MKNVTSFIFSDVQTLGRAALLFARKGVYHMLEMQRLTIKIPSGLGDDHAIDLLDEAEIDFRVER